jgi:hypothetical protein
MTRNSVGKTLRFRFEDGPMAGQTFEHVFDPGGVVRYRHRDSMAEGRRDVCVLSYLGPSGYTLTVVLDYRTKRLVAFSPDEKMHLLQHGTFEEIAS